MSKLTGSADNIFSLVQKAQEKILNGEESPGIGVCMENIVEELNKSDYKKSSTFNLSKEQLYKQIFLQAKKLVNQNKGHLGLTFISPYLNRLSEYVHNKSFENEYGKFSGVLYDIKQGIEKIPNQSSLSNEDNAYLTDLKALGITGTVNKLSSSRFEPEQCIEETKNTLYFMGLLGSKWVADKGKFVEFLKKVQSKPHGKVRYLMIDPTGKSFKQLKTMRGENLKDVSTQVFRELVDEFKCLEAKFYDFLPCFRLIFIDNKICAASRYKLDESNYIKSKQGWEAPHLVIDAEQGDWSLYEPFLSYYETIWEQAKDIREVINKKSSTNGKSKIRRNTR